jgi:hypothetical protein
VSRLLASNPVPSEVATLGAAVYDKGGQVYHSKPYGAKFNWAQVFDASMTIGQPNVNSATIGFVTRGYKIGDYIAVNGAGAAGGILKGTIASIIKNTQVTMNVNAVATVNTQALEVATIDTTSINAAFTAATAGGGGNVLAPTGTAIVDNSSSYTGPNANATSLEIPDKIGFIGVNHWATTIREAAASAATVVQTQANTSHQIMADMTIDGYKAGQTDVGIDGGQVGLYGLGVQFGSFMRLRCVNSPHEGIYQSNGSWGTTQDCITSGNNRAGIIPDANQLWDYVACKSYQQSNAVTRAYGAGMYITGGAGPTAGDFPITVLGGDFWTNQGDGISAVFNKSARVVGSRLKLNVFDGAFFNTCDSVECASVISYQNQRSGIEYLTTPNSKITGGHIKNNSQGGQGLYNGIYLYTSSHCTVTSATCTDDGGTKMQKYGILTDGGTDFCTITGNDLAGNFTGPLLATTGTNHFISKNQGYNPVVITTPAVSTPLTNTFNVDVWVSFIANAAGTTMTINTKALAATPANAQGSVFWPAGTVMSYVNAPASWVFIGT